MALKIAPKADNRRLAIYPSARRWSSGELRSVNLGRVHAVIRREATSGAEVYLGTENKLLRNKLRKISCGREPAVPCFQPNPQRSPSEKLRARARSSLLST